jgi:hypothetical protein
MTPGWFMAKDSAGEWWNASDERGEYQTGHGYDGKALPTSPARLVSMLWTAEVKMAIDIHGVFVPQKKSAAFYLAEEVPLKLLRPTVYWLLHRRKWESARFGAKLIYRPAHVSAA